MFLYTPIGISISTSSICRSWLSLSTLMVTICSPRSCFDILRDITGVLLVLTERMLELDLLLDSVLDLEWRLALLALTALAWDKLGLRQLRLASRPPVKDFVLGSDVSRCLYFGFV